MKKLKIRLADKSEISKAFSLLKGAAIWLKEKNIDYWQNWINPSDLYSNWIKEGFDSNQFYYVIYDSRVIAMFRLQWNDELFWGVQDDNAGYIHSFTTDRIYQGQGIGIKILQMIEDLCRQNNKQYLRLDCGVLIQGLCNYYEKFGFYSVGEIDLHGERLRLYEKRLFN
ncbi:MAG: GNAT family N-acetyltransferase [Candidatus Atribacteria bacterium]|nr:GNAT family N-acetyltransferase [Candidatus Atribacteria bacterium]